MISDDGSKEPDDFIKTLRALREAGPPYVAQARELLHQLRRTARRVTRARKKSYREEAAQEMAAMLDRIEHGENPSAEWLARYVLRRACDALKLALKPLPCEPEQVSDVAECALQRLPPLPVGRPPTATAPILKVAIELNAQRDRDASADGTIFDDDIWRVEQGISTESADVSRHRDCRSALAESSADPKDDNAMETAHRTASRMRHRKKR